jgi:hypothetical protein
VNSNTDATRRILIAGAKNVGKTALLAAIERASLQNRTRGPRLTFSPMLRDADAGSDSKFIPHATDRYLSRAAEFFLRGVGFAATESPQSYDFRLGVQQGRTALKQYQFVDAPGEYTSPYDLRADNAGRKELLEKSRDGYALVFCFEALPDSDPAAHLMNLEFNLSNLLSNLSAGDGRMSLARVLFLLTKIDIPTKVFYDRSSQDCPLPFPLTPMQLAQRLNPLEQMRSIVGSENISKFLYPNSECEFAVGVCSAFGFDSFTGQPMVSPYTNLPMMPPGRSPEEHYRLWTPFGVREALLFLTLGDSSDCVKRISPRDADYDDCPRNSYIPYRSGR